MASTQETLVSAAYNIALPPASLRLISHPPKNSNPIVTEAVSSTTATLRPNNSDMQTASRAELLTRDYPAAVTDFYGTPSSGLTVYRTGEPWRGLSPAESGGYPCHRELIPVGNHPMVPRWETEIAPRIVAFLDECNLIFNTLAVIGVKNQGDLVPVAPCVIVIGCDPGSVTFAEAKSALDHIKAAILVDHFGFNTIDIALRDCIVTKTATRANQQRGLPSILKRPEPCN